MLRRRNDEGTISLLIFFPLQVTCAAVWGGFLHGQYSHRGQWRVSGGPPSFFLRGFLRFSPAESIYLFQ